MISLSKSSMEKIAHAIEHTDDLGDGRINYAGMAQAALDAVMSTKEMNRLIVASEMIAQHSFGPDNMVISLTNALKLFQPTETDDAE